jgi:adenosylhomocysteine nucleosidase
MTSRKLLLVALEQELPKVGLADWSIVYTGVGKVNAAIALMAALTETKPDLLINYGTAGATRSGLAHIVEIGQSVQCDMDVRPLGVALGATPFETGTECFYLSDSPFVCGTGDRFVTSPPELRCDLVDMELYALAKIAAREEIVLKSFKFISDHADDNAQQDWKDSLPDAASAFLHIQDDLLRM